MQDLLERLRRLAPWYQRLKFVPQLLVFQACAAAVLALPVIGYRLVEGDWQQAAINTAIVLALISIAVAGARSGQRVAGLLFVSTYVLAAWLIALFRGPLGAYWSYPVACAIFFVLRAREAFAINILTAILCGTLIYQARSAFEAIQYLSTYALVCVFSAKYASAMRDENRLLAMRAYTDPLTGVRNRRQLDEDIAALITSAQDPATPGKPLTLSMIDIDHFKHVNDVFGHSVGDTFLRRLTQLIEHELDLNHRLYRFGDEEFVVLSTLETAAAAQALERVRQAVFDSRLLREMTEPITVSVGVAGWQPGLDPIRWLDRADEAMYESKAQGRNRMTVYRAGPDAAPRQDP